MITRIALSLLTAASLGLLVCASTESPRQPRMAGETTCFKTGEKDAGMNRICYYDCLGSEAAITIKSTQICPLSIKR